MAMLEDALISIYEYEDKRRGKEGKRAAQFVLCLSEERIYSIDQAVNNLTACNERQ